MVYQSLLPEMDERMRRQWAAAEAKGFGRSGITAVSQATGLSRVMIAAGLAEPGVPPEQRLCHATRRRRPGGGGPYRTETCTMERFEEI